MGKNKSTQSPMNTSKHQKKRLHSLIKVSRPKVYITQSSNFKELVQQLTGKRKCSPVVEPSWGNHRQHHLAYYRENTCRSSIESSFDTSCFATPLEGSSDLSRAGSLGSQMGNSSEIYKDLEAMLMEMDEGVDACYNNGLLQQEQVCVYDYDIYV